MKHKNKLNMRKYNKPKNERWIGISATNIMTNETLKVYDIYRGPRGGMFIRFQDLPGSYNLENWRLSGTVRLSE